MSVMQEYENCVYISHNKYIEKIYQNLNNTTDSYKLNQHLFNINKPYKKQTLKRKYRDETNTTYDKIQNDIKYLSEKYTRFYSKLKSELFPAEDNLTRKELDNSEALECSRKLYSESEIDLVTNTEGSNLHISAIVSVSGKEYLFPRNCKFYCKDVKNIGENLNLEKFDLIILDPPWWNKAVRRKRAKNNHGYEMMRNEDLIDLPIENLVTNDGIIVIWCTNSPQHIQACKDMFKKWGVELTAEWFWLKITRNGEKIINFAEPPAKLPFERVLIATKCGVKNKGLEDTEGKIIISVPSALHSHKPPLQEVLEPYVKKDGKNLEIFARYLLPGYTSYGLEALRFQHISLYQKYVSI